MAKMAARARRITLAQTGAKNRATAFGLLTFGSLPLEAPSNDVGIGADQAPFPELKWINVANEGLYKGHHQGEFNLTPQVFQQLVDNLHRSPKYLAGPVELGGATTQAGTRNVVQLDYEHASEMAPWEGSIPTSGAPACGWVRDLDVRQGPDGKAQLYALCWFGPELRAQIDAGQYDSVSIAWNPDGVDWRTGEPIGAVLTSIAITNHPFLQDLASLAAVSRAAAGGPPRRPVPDAAGDTRKRIVERRASTAEAYAGSSTPPGSLRSPWEREPMPPEIQQLLARLCSVYRLQPSADNASIIRAAEQAAASGGTLDQVLAALGVPDAAAALQGVPALVAARGKLQELMSELDGLMTADAAADATAAPQDVAAAMSARGWVQRGMVDPVMYTAVLAARASAVDAEIAKLPKDKQTVGEKRLARERGRQAFLATYGVNQNPAAAHLMSTFVSGPGAAGAHTQFQVPLPAQPLPGAPQQVAHFGGAQPGFGAQPLQLPQPQAFGGAQPQGQGGIDLSEAGPYQGRNLTERVMSYLGSADPAFTKLSHDQRVNRAAAWKRQNPQFLPQQAA